MIGNGILQKENYKFITDVKNLFLHGNINATFHLN